MPKNQRGLIGLVLIVLIPTLLGLAVVGSLFYFKPDLGNFTKVNNTNTDNPAVAETTDKTDLKTQGIAPTQSLSKVKVIHSLETYNGKTQTRDKPRFLLSDVTRQEITTFDINADPRNLSPNKKYYMRVVNTAGKNTVEVSNKETPGEYKTILDLSLRKNNLGLYNANWTSDGNKIYYELRNTNPSESQVYTINPDGSEEKLVGKIGNFPGGHFIGYDSIRNEFYDTMNYFDKKEQALVKFTAASQKVEEIFRIPMDLGITTNPDYTKAYYAADGLAVTEFDLNKLSKKTVYDIKKHLPDASPGNIDIRMSEDGSLLFLTYYPKTDPPSPQKSQAKIILNLKTGDADNSLSDSKFSDYSIHPFDTFSPDNNYVFLSALPQKRPPAILKTGTESATENTPMFYSSRNCIWDILNKKMIPFFNCPFGDGEKEFTDIANQDVHFVTWFNPL